MLTLVYKDFLLQRGAKSFIYMLVMPVVSAFAFSTDALYVIMPYIAGSYLYIVYANALDDKYKSENIFISMPVKRSSIVGAKYLGMFAYMIVFLAAVSVLSLLIRLFVPGFEAVTTISWSLIVQFIIIAAVYYGILFPLYFKLGYIKSRWVNYIAMIFSAGIYITATKGMTAFTGIEIASLQASLMFFTGLDVHVWNIVLPVLSAVITAASLQLSVSFYSRREF